MLALSIKFENHQFATQLYGKRDDFLISIAGMPYLTGNILSKLFYNT